MIISLVTLFAILNLMIRSSVVVSFRLRRNQGAQFLSSHRYSRSLSMTSSETSWPVEAVRSKFVDYFVAKHGHTNYKSSPVVPVNDPTLLFANAGMNQFKPIFVGTVDPSSPLAGLRRAVNSQKCIRAGGKHNDLDDVGKDTYHHTFFEMLGTWSFGNYFKREAITWAYDILVNEYKLNPERLYASYFGGDESLGLPCDNEAREIWLELLPPERVLPFDKKANFWEMGDTGPCGPCSEIHFDRIGGRDAASLVNADDPDVIEIWNLVFIQFNRETSGELRQLPDKHIDTGMGLERLTSILQDKRSNYDTDVFMPIFKAIENLVGCPPYTGKLAEEDAAQNFRDTAYRVVADHIRTLTFAITDGAIPSNEGRGYVLRRVLRRAVRYGMQTLGAKPGFFSQLVPVVVKEFGSYYPELASKEAFVTSVISEEEQSFSSMVDRGIKYFNEIVVQLETENKNVIPGDRAFYLYDTVGFPVDLTQIMASEKGFTVDLNGFQQSMTEQKERSRAAGRAKKLAGRTDLTLAAEQTSFLQKSGVLPTNDDHKYIWDKTLTTSIKAIYTSSGFVDKIIQGGSDDLVGLVLEDTPFYAEAGGQVADTGVISINGINFDVLDVQTYGGYILHICSTDDVNDLELLRVSTTVEAKVDYDRRKKIAPNHSMTHVLNYALRHILGTDVEQKGSLVSDEKFRFDFSLNRAVTVDELKSVEDIVNDVIKQELVVNSDVVPLQDALKINGLRAVFGETYPDPVRVISVGPKVSDLVSAPTNNAWIGHSIEFCGGTHISNTKDAEVFVILEETAVAKGIRRVSGITGHDAKIASQLSSEIAHETDKLRVDIAKVLATEESSSSTESSVITTLENTVAQTRTWLEESQIAQTAKYELRSSLDKMKMDLFNLRTKKLLAAVDEEIKTARQQALQSVQEFGAEKPLVLNVKVGSDAKAIKRTIDELKKISPLLSFLCISPESDRITVFSFVSEEAQKVKGLKANEWVARTVAVGNGRGGGKPGQAQGSASDVSKLESIISEANNFCSV